MPELPNIPTIDEIAADGAKIAELDLETIALLIEDAKARSSQATTVSRALQAEVEERFKAEIASIYLAEGKDTGTIHLARDGFDIEVNRAKKVAWDQAVLAEVRAKIEAANDNPAEYIDTALSVPERKFIAWPEHIQAQFEAARTVTPGSTSIKIGRAA